MDVVALPNFDVKILLACTLPLCDAAQQLRSHCPDAGIKENVSCFFYRDINFVEQQGFRMVNFTSASMRKVATLTHQVDWPWVAAALCTFVLLGSLARWLCTVLPDPRHATYEALRQVERDLEITEQMKTRMRILAETVMLAIDLALDLKVGVYYCSQKLWLFGPVALAIPGLAGLACFGYKRWNWRQATPDANQRMAQRTQYYFQKLDAKGHAKPNLLVMLRHVFQLEAFATAYQAYQKPELYERDWLVERTFNGALEAFPQCLLQTYTLLCLEQEDMLKDPMDTATQLVSIAFSCYGITTALQHMSFSLLPEESISPLPLGFAGWQLQLLQFMDVASRLLTWATLGAAWRTPSAAIDENCEFGLPILMALELIGVVGLLHASLRWTSSFSSEAILSAAIAYLTMPMLVFNASYANMSKLQGSLCFWRAVETFTCLCFVWYRGHAVSEPDGLLLAFMACSVFTHIVVHATVMYDRAMRFQHGRPVLPAIHAAQFTEAHWACALNNLQLLQDSGPEALCARARHGWVPAHVAAWSGNEALLRLLHNMVPESLSARTDHDWVPAEVAALNSHEAALRLRYDLVADHQDWTPAHLAAHCGHEATLKLLHDLVPVSLSTRTRRGWVPAHLAALHGHGDVLRLLHDLVPETFSSKDNDDWVPAHLAAQNGHTASLGFMYLLVPESLSARTNRDWVPAHVAALNGHGAALRLLYDLVPATLSAKTHHDSVAAHLAALNGHKAALRLLHELVPDTLSAKDNNNFVPAHFAARNGHAALLREMHQLLPESLSAKTSRGSFPSHLAALNNHVAVLRLLHDLVPGTLSGKDRQGSVPAHMAAQNGHAAALGLLYELVPESLSVRDGRGRVPAHFAALNGHEAALRLLYDLVPETLSTKDNDDLVPAHLAARNGHQAALQLLHDLVAMPAKDVQVLSTHPRSRGQTLPTLLSSR